MPVSDQASFSDHASAQRWPQRVGAATDATGAMAQLLTGSINTIATKYQVISLAVLTANSMLCESQTQPVHGGALRGVLTWPH